MLKTLAASSLLGAVSAEWLGDTLPQDVADAFGAKCLNGAPPSYEIFLPHFAHRKLCRSIHRKVVKGRTFRFAPSVARAAFLSSTSR